MYYILFTTTTCIKCPSFKKIVAEKVKFDGKIIDENSFDFMDLLSRFSVMSAPTFVVFEDESLNNEIIRCSEESDLESFLEQQKKDK